MDWSHEFCLSCDRQISQSDHGAYCSQSCRLADLERASASSAPSSYASTTSRTGNGSGFYLPPALNFASPSHHSAAAAYSPSSRSPTYPTATRQGSERGLYSSPSRSSLSSLHSHGRSEPAALSDKVKNELREYAGSFDHIRDWKRRMTVV